MRIGIGIGVSFMGAMGGFSPLSLDQGGTLKLWVRSDDPDAALESGSDTDLRRVDSLTNRGALGGTMAQATSANKPVLATFPEGRAGFYADTDLLRYDGAATDFNFLTTGNWTIAFPIYGTVSTSGTTIILDNAAMSSTNVGLSIARSGTTTLTVTLRRGGGASSAASFSGALANWGTGKHDVVLTYDGVNCTCYVDGAQVGSPTALTAHSAAQAFALAAGETVGGFLDPNYYLPEIVIYNRVLSASEIAQLEAYLGRWKLSWTDNNDYAYWDSVDAFEEWFDADSGVTGTSPITAWAGRAGNHSSSSVEGTPTLNASDANFNSEASIAFLAASSEAFRLGGDWSIFSGSDKPITVIVVSKRSGTAANYAEFGLGNSASNNTLWYMQNQTTNLSVQKRDDALVSVNLTAAGADASAHIWDFSTRGTTTSVDQDGARLLELSSQDVGSTTVDQAAIGAMPQGASSLVSKFDGEIASVLIFRRFLNMGDRVKWKTMLATRYGTP